MFQEFNINFKLFAFLSFFQIMQFISSFGFSIIFSRIINPEYLGEWTSCCFLFNLYFTCTDFGLESSLFLKTKELNQNQLVFNSIFFFRSIVSIFPLLIFGIFHFFIFKLNIIIFFYALYFFLEKTTTLCKFWIDSSSKQSYQSLIDFISLISCNILCLLFYPIIGTRFILGIQKIVEKILLFIFSYFKLPKINFRNFNLNLIKKSFNLFGLPTLKSNISGIFIYEFYPFILSLFLGNYAAGIFAKSFSLACLPMLLTTVCNRITTPMYGEERSIEDFKKIFLSSFLIKLIILIPCTIILYVSAWFWIPKLLGNHWAMVVPCYRILLIYSFFRCFYDDTGPLFNLAFKSPNLFAQNQIFHACLILMSIPIVIFTKSIFITCIISSISMLATTLNIFIKIGMIMKFKKEDVLMIFIKKPLAKL